MKTVGTAAGPAFLLTSVKLRLLVSSLAEEPFVLQSAREEAPAQQLLRRLVDERVFDELSSITEAASLCSSNSNAARSPLWSPRLWQKPPV